jgi:hypothetical protein
MLPRAHQFIFLLAALVPATAIADDTTTLPENYCSWEVVDYAIEKPLCGLVGDAQRGKKLSRTATWATASPATSCPFPGSKLTAQ